MQSYIKKIIEPFIKSKIKQHNLESGKDHALLIFDCWSVHKSQAFMGWLQNNYPTFHFVFIPAGCTSVSQPADVLLQRPLKHEFSNQYTEWTTTQTLAQIKSGGKPADVRITKDIKTLKPLVVKWMIEAWTKLKSKQEMIKTGWEKIGFDKLLDETFQKRAAQMVGKKELKLDYDLETEKIEEEKDEADVIEEEEDEEEEVADEEEDEDIESALSRCIEKRLTIGTRRSTRLQLNNDTQEDVHIARQLQEQVLDRACRLKY